MLKDILPEFIEIFSDTCGTDDLKITSQLESVLGCTAESSTISAVFNLYEDDVNKEQLHSNIQQFLASNNLNTATPRAVLKLFAENRILTNSFPSVAC